MTESDPLTAGDLSRIRKWEWGLTSIVLGLMGTLNLLAFITSTFFIPAGQLFGEPLLDQLFSVAAALSSHLYFYAAYTIGFRSLCRYCVTELQDSHFRCPKCGRLVGPEKSESSS